MGQYLDALRKRGFSVWLEGGKARVSPRARLTDSLRDGIREYRDHMVAELETEAEEKREANRQGPFERRGWCAIRSEVLDEVVVGVTSLAVRVPKKYNDAVVYTESELALLQEAAPEQLREVHRVKKTIRGRVVKPDSWPFDDNSDDPQNRR